MSNLSLSEHAILLCQLAEHQDKLDDDVEQKTIEYLRAQQIATKKLEELRSAIDLRDAMSKSRKYVGGAK